MMASLRKTAWFVMVALLMAGWMGALGSLRGVAEAGIIASHLSEAAERSEDMAKVQSFLENKVVVQQLIDYGVSSGEAKAKVEAMSARDLHRLASLTDRAAAGGRRRPRPPHAGQSNLTVVLVLVAPIREPNGGFLSGWGFANRECLERCDSAPGGVTSNQLPHRRKP